MGNTKKTTAEKLQEVIMAKTMNSLESAPAAEETKKPAKAVKTKEVTKPAKEETKATKAKKGTKADDKEPKEEKRGGGTAKYTYPEECTSSLERKKFRAEFRNKVKKYEANLAKTKEGSKEYKAILKEYQTYKSTYIRG